MKTHLTTLCALSLVAMLAQRLDAGTDLTGVSGDLTMSYQIYGYNQTPPVATGYFYLAQLTFKNAKKWVAWCNGVKLKGTYAASDGEFELTFNARSQKRLARLMRKEVKAVHNGPVKVKNFRVTYARGRTFFNWYSFKTLISSFAFEAECRLTVNGQEQFAEFWMGSN